MLPLRFFFTLLFISGIILPKHVSGAALLPSDNVQTGTLTGTVTDRETSEPIGFTYLYLEEANRTSTAHNDGRFEFTNIPAGTYTLMAQRIGYRTLTQTVHIPANDTLELTISLQPSVLSSATVEVTGQSDAARRANLEHASKRISGTQLRQELGNTLSKSLENIPGFESRSMGAAPARPVMRGLGGERVLILQDGERTGDVSSQSADHAVTVDPMAAEEIEIARGPAALIYGSNAIGGVINVVRNQISSNMPDHTHGSASLQGESVNTGGVAAVEANIPVGSFVVQADANFRTAGDLETPAGTLQNSGIVSSNNAVGISYVRPWGYAGAASSMYINHYGIPPDPEGGHAEGVDIEMRKYQFDGASELYLDGAFHSVTADISYKNYFHKEIEPGGITGTEFGLLTANASVKAYHRKAGPLDSGTIGIWAESKDYAVNGANTPDSDAYSFALFAVEEKDLGPLHLEAGLRFDHYRAVPAEENPDSRIGFIRPRSFSALASSVSAIYNLGKGYYAGSTLMHSFRPPSQEELYSEGPHLASYSYEIGNPDLDAERGFGKELFLRYRGEKTSAELAVYHNSFTNYIYPRNTGRQNSRFPSLNDYQFEGSPSLLYGFEASGEVQLMPHIVFGGSVGYTHGERELTGLERELNPDADETQPLPMIPPLKGSLSVTYASGGFQAGVKTTMAARQNRIGDFESPTDGYALLDIFGQHRFQAGSLLHTVSLNINNLLNQEYYNHLSRIKDIMPEPGRNVSLLYRMYF